jgi:hypothetical protein
MGVVTTAERVEDGGRHRRRAAAGLPLQRQCDAFSAQLAVRLERTPELRRPLGRFAARAHAGVRETASALLAGGCGAEPVLLASAIALDGVERAAREGIGPRDARALREIALALAAGDGSLALHRALPSRATVCLDAALAAAGAPQEAARWAFAAPLAGYWEVVAYGLDGPRPALGLGARLLTAARTWLAAIPPSVGAHSAAALLPLLGETAKAAFGMQASAPRVRAPLPAWSRP